MSSARRCNRRSILSAGMIAVRGRVQRDGEVVHLVAQRLTDLSAEVASVGERDTALPLQHGHGDEFHHGLPTPDPRGLPRTRDIYIPNLYLHTIRVKTRDFAESQDVNVLSCVLEVLDTILLVLESKERTMV